MEKFKSKDEFSIYNLWNIKQGNNGNAESDF